MFELTILVLSAIANILLGIIVYLKNTSSTTNKLFLFLTTSFVAWSIVTYLSDHPVDLSQIWWIRLVLFFAVYLCLVVYLTFEVFPHYELPPAGLYRKIGVLATVIIMPLTLTPVVFKGVKVQNGSAHPIPNFGIALFFIVVVYLLGGGIFTLLKKYKHSRGKQKLQIKFVLFGLTGAFSLIVLTNFIFVVVFNNSKLIPFGPAYTLIFSGALAYSIIKHRLFDIRAAVTRVLVYLLSLCLIGVTYGVIVFLLLRPLTKGSITNTQQEALYIVIALLTALGFQRIKHFFDRITNRIFFKDAYDPQVLIDRLNDILVRTIQLDELLYKTEEVIEKTLKAEYICFILLKTKEKPIRVVGKGNKKLTLEIAEDLVNYIDSSREEAVIADELVDEGKIKLLNLMGQADAAAALSLKTNKQHIGYLIVGLKQSGDSYQPSDLTLLKIISDEISLAIQNALRFEEIQNFNATLQERIIVATRQLRSTNEKLKALDETKDEFISMASHQLRTPLTSMKGYVSMVLEGDSGKINRSQKDLLNQAFTSSQRMVYLIADLLNVSRLKTGKFVIEAKPTSLADVIETEISQITETAKAKNLKLTYDKPKDFPALMLDETKIRQVIMNFVDNAIYYTHSNGHINVKLVNNPDTIEFTVTDDGIGVPKAEAHHLFTKFYRAGNAKKARPDGTGLGLFMAKKVIVAQGGALIFNSEEGKGSTFGFTFSKEKFRADPKQPQKPTPE